ncbi:MAG: hypothetical protein LBL00_05700, partial [Endomicrobium sp.]|nr:hypothetical protein [Endomicrobium sp.]
RFAVNRENSNGIIGIKAEDAGRNVEVNAAILGRLSAQNIRNVVTVETRSDTINVKEAWLDFSVGERVYNRQTSDAAQIAGNIESALESDAAALGLDWEIISAMKNTAEGENIVRMIKNIVNKKISLFKSTPEGRYNAGRKVALSKADIKLNPEQENSLYKLLNDMRSASSADASLAANLYEAFPNAKTKQLSEAAASSDDQKASLVFEEAKGYLQGILEKTQSDAYIGDIEFKVKTDIDIYRTALVEAKMYKVLNNIGTQQAEKVPYIHELRDNNGYVAESDASVNAELERAKNLVESISGKLTTATIAEIQPSVREAINILTSLIESDSLSRENKPMALSELLAMLALYSDRVEKTTVEKGQENFAEMQEGIKAMLRAA